MLQHLDKPVGMTKDHQYTGSPYLMLKSVPCGQYVKLQVAEAVYQYLGDVSAGE